MRLLVLRDRKSEEVKYYFMIFEFEILVGWILINKGIIEFFIVILRFKWR